MALSPLAGRSAPASSLVDVPRLVSAYYTLSPEPGEPAHQISFGTSGHRGGSLSKSFNEAHILAIAQAVCEKRRADGIDGPLFLGFDSHALSEPAFATALEVFAANGVLVVRQAGRGLTPTPALSHAILVHNRGRREHLADGVVITPSHNPPDSGGFKYNPPHGGPADTDVTKAIETRANQLLADESRGVKRIPFERALASPDVREHDFVGPYVADLARVLDLDAVRGAGLRIGVDPMGGAALPYWSPIADRYRLDLTVVNERVDPTFAFMRLDHDAKIRMDCSSPCAMAGLIEQKERFDLALGTDTDADRHGIVTKDGLMNPNHFLAVAVAYLFKHRPGWRKDAAIGKTLVSSAILDRVAKELGRPLLEVPVGFKWFVPGLLDGTMGFGGEESAGASFLRMDGSVWTTDKDGILMGLLAAEISARTGRSPSENWREIARRLGDPVYERTDAPIAPDQKKRLANLAPESLEVTSLAGEPIVAKLSHAPGNGAPIGGIKVIAASGWFAARPSGTEDVYKIYAESFQGPDHLRRLQAEAQAIVDGAFSA